MKLWLLNGEGRKTRIKNPLSPQMTRGLDTRQVYDLLLHHYITYFTNLDRIHELMIGPWADEKQRFSYWYKFDISPLDKYEYLLTLKTRTGRKWKTVDDICPSFIKFLNKS